MKSISKLRPAADRGLARFGASSQNHETNRFKEVQVINLDALPDPASPMTTEDEDEDDGGDCLIRDLPGVRSLGIKRKSSFGLTNTAPPQLPSFELSSARKRYRGLDDTRKMRTGTHLQQVARRMDFSATNPSHTQVGQIVKNEVNTVRRMDFSATNPSQIQVGQLVKSEVDTGVTELGNMAGGKKNLALAKVDEDRQSERRTLLSVQDTVCKLKIQVQNMQEASAKRTSGKEEQSVLHRKQLEDLKALHAQPVAEIMVNNCREVEDLKALHAQEVAELLVKDFKKVEDLNALHAKEIAEINENNDREVSALKIRLTATNEFKLQKEALIISQTREIADLRASLAKEVEALAKSKHEVESLKSMFSLEKEIMTDRQKGQMAALKSKIFLALHDKGDNLEEHSSVHVESEA